MNSKTNITCHLVSGLTVHMGRSIRAHMYTAAVLFFLISFTASVMQAQDLLPDGCEVVGQQVVCIYDSSDSFTVPDGINEISVEAWGAGGGGSATGNHGRGGGGGGAYVQSLLDVIPGNSYTFIVGSGGAADQAGEDTYFDTQGTLLARAGSPGIETDGGNGGDGTMSIGDVRFSGGIGGDGQVGGGSQANRAGGGGGGSAFSDGNGGTGISGNGGSPGSGGAGTGDGGEGGIGTTAGQPGLVPGGGGGGGGTNGPGGSGADGRIVISYEYLPDNVDLRVQYLNGETNSITQSLRPRFIVFNDDDYSAVLSDITIRYWFESEPAGDDVHIVDWAAVGTGSVTGLFGEENEERYLEIGFTENANVPFWLGGDGSNNRLSAGANTGEIQNRIHDSNWGQYDQNNDYSWDPSVTNFSDYENVSVYYRGELVWGTTPVTDDPQTFYSLNSGNWQQAESWTFDESHTGPAANRIPSEEDLIIIGANHIITLSDHVVNNADIQIVDTGTLSAGSYTVSGTGIFSLLPGGTLGIGSQGGISSTDNTGNIRSETRSFSSEANYLYNGSVTQFTGDGLPAIVNNLMIDNNAGVISEAGTNRTVTGTLTLSNGVFTMAPGTSLVTQTGGVDASGGGRIRMQQVIDGGEGYRMISSPVMTDYNDLLDGFITQGITGSDWPARQPNMLYFLETYADSGSTANQSWRTISSLTDNVSNGQGYFFYVFGDIPGDSDYSDPLPKTMSAAGVEPAFSGSGGTYEFDVSYTPTRETTSYLEGWNLVGNPTTATLNWDSNEWNRANIDETIYVWDPTANGGAGDYLVWNGVVGDLPDEGLIAPFQSFWVKANGENPDMSITDQVKTTGGSFVNDPGLMSGINKEEPIAVSINLLTGNLEGTIFLTFSDDGRLDKDRMDAYRLQPLSGSTYLTFYTSAGGSEDAPLQINNLPRDLDQKIHIPLQVGANVDGEPLSEDHTLEWSIPESWPQDWTITLMDHRRQEGISMRNRNHYTFWHDTPRNNQLRASIESVSADSRMKMPAQLLKPAGIVSPEAHPSRMRTNAEESRFTIVIEPGGDPNSTEYIPDKATLMQNYPNPFNSATNIRMALPDRSDVVLEVYDMIGRRVATLANGSYPAGTHNFNWDASGVASGMYIYRFRTDQTALSKKMLLVK